MIAFFFKCGASVEDALERNNQGRDQLGNSVVRNGGECLM